MAFKRKKFLGCLRCSNIRAYGVRYSREGERLARWASGSREGGRGRRFARCFAGESALAREESRLPPTAPGEIAGGGEVRPGGGKRGRGYRRRSRHSSRHSSNRGFPPAPRAKSRRRDAPHYISAAIPAVRCWIEAPGDLRPPNRLDAGPQLHPPSRRSRACDRDRERRRRSHETKG